VTRRRYGDLKVAAIFLLPATIGFVVFYVWPTLRGAYLSFTEYSLLTPPRFNGLDNYERMLQDSFFWNALVVTLEYVVINIGLQTVLAIGIAMLMFRLTKSIAVRGIILMPYLIANVVVALVWYWMLDYQIGIVNQLLTWVGIDPIAFFGESVWGIPTIALINVWRHMGYTALLVFAGLQTIPKYVYEAAEVDGSGELQTFWRITLPAIRWGVAYGVVLTTARVLGEFGAVTIVSGSISGETETLPLFVAKAFEQFNEEAAYAGAIVLALLALTTLLLMSIGGRKAKASTGRSPVAAEVAVSTSTTKEGP